MSMMGSRKELTTFELGPIHDESHIYGYDIRFNLEEGDIIETPRTYRCVEGNLRIGGQFQEVEKGFLPIQISATLVNRGMGRSWGHIEDVVAIPQNRISRKLLIDLATEAANNAAAGMRFVGNHSPVSPEIEELERFMDLASS